MSYFRTCFNILILAALAMASPIGNETGGPSPDIVCETTTSRQTALVGNGDPHQNFVYKQVSGGTDCTGNPGGSASVTESQTVGWSLSLSGAADFITGGFDVSESTTTGFTNSFGCAITGGGSASGTLCVFERIQLTAYTANTRECTTSSCTGTTCGAYMNDVVIYAPNSDQSNCYYDSFQLNLPCQGLGTEQYVYSGPAGGLQYIAC